MFVAGRKRIFETLSQQIRDRDKVIWMHAASLGEFEQGLPILQRLKREKPDCKTLVTFFSPSGYEVKKNSDQADMITYLPLDTGKNARKFLTLVHPEFALFVKYEFWPNYLTELKKQNIPAFLISGVFREAHIFFKPYGGFMRKQLAAFEHFFVQEETSKTLLNGIGFYNVTVSGDTRFDRVSKTLEQDIRLPFIETFLRGKPCVVTGSSWPEDEALLVPFINSYKGNAKFIIAPHLVKASVIARLKRTLTKTTVLFSERDTEKLADQEVLIVDTVGMLSRIYRYAIVAYVGGGMGKKGLHNILEAAVFGIPVMIGKNYKKFNEAETLVALGGVVPVKSEEELALALRRFLSDETERLKRGAINAGYIRKQRGATKIIVNYLLGKKGRGDGGLPDYIQKNEKEM